MNAPTVAPARPDEWARALDLAFRHLPDDQRRTRIVNTLSLLSNNEIAPECVLVARDCGDVVGVLMCIPLPGRSGLFWPPQSDSHAALAALVSHALGWLRGRGSKLGQALLTASEMALAQPLLDAGFAHLTQLHYLRHDLDQLPTKAVPTPHLVIEKFSLDNEAVFRETLLRSYEGTLDCPELNGRRTIDEILDAHRHHGKFRPDLWWLAFAHDLPVAVVLLAELHGWEGWDLAYLGVVPDARGHGIGDALVRRVLHEAQRAHQPQLICAVDGRNAPARQLYAKLGFSEEGTREVLLYFFEHLPG